MSEVEIPIGWKIASFDDIAKNEKYAIKRGPWGSSIKKDFFVSNGFKVYQQHNVIYDDFDYGNYYLSEKKFGELKEIMDLDSIPFPAYHLVPMHMYYPSIGAYRKLPAINMLMTRGCPGKCTFCNSAETTLRTRSADKVVDEIIRMKKEYGIQER